MEPALLQMQPSRDKTPGVQIFCSWVYFSLARSPEGGNESHINQVRQPRGDVPYSSLVPSRVAGPGDSDGAISQGRVRRASAVPSAVQ